MMQQQTIPCPVCQTPIPFEAHALLRGEKFTCPQCSAAVAISTESIEQTRKAFEAYETLEQIKGH